MLDEQTTNLLARAKTESVARMATIQSLQEGQFGVLEVTVDQIQPTRTFARKKGGDGRFTKVIVADGTGEIAIVFWGDEWERVADLVVPQAPLRLCGLTVKPGFRGGVELHLGNGRIEPVTGTQEFWEGTIRHVGPAQPLTSPPPHVKREVTLQMANQERTLALFDDAATTALACQGARVKIGPIAPHPLLEGRYISLHAHIQKQ